MMKLIVDRYENEYLICVQDGDRFFAIPKEEAPSGLKKGAVLLISDEGEITVQGA